VEDAAFGYITMKNGALILLESSWALNTLDVKEAKTTCAVPSGRGHEDGLRINKAWMGALTTVKPVQGKGVDSTMLARCPGRLEAARWIDAVRNDTRPCPAPAGAGRDRDSGGDLRVRPDRKAGVLRLIFRVLP
jgi:hypothetical protein